MAFFDGAEIVAHFGVRHEIADDQGKEQKSQHDVVVGQLRRVEHEVG